MIQNRNNDKVYIGQTTTNLNSYFSKVKYKAMSGETGKPHLFNAIRKHGKDAFDIRPIYTAQSAEELDTAEKTFIKFFNSQNKEFGYNVSAGGRFGQITSEETKEKLRNHNLGKKASLETRLKMSKSQKDAMTEERKAVMSSFATGRLHTDEAKLKISKAKKGKPRDTSYLLQYHVGVPRSDETRKKISESNKGHTHSEKSKLLMSEKLKQSWARRKAETGGALWQ